MGIINKIISAGGIGITGIIGDNIKTMENIEKESNDFEKNKEYIDNLRDTIQLEQEAMGFDKKDSKNIVKGSNVLLDGIGEKLNINISDDFMIFIKNKKLSSDEFINLLKVLKKKGHSSTKIISKYLKMSLKERELKELKEIIKEGISREISL